MVPEFAQELVETKLGFTATYTGVKRGGDKQDVLGRMQQEQTLKRHVEGMPRTQGVVSRRNMRSALERILEYSDLNVRILTRSPLAREDFDLFRRFGNRLVFGVSLPTLDDVHARLYEPHAPGPTQRLELLKDAHAAGIPTFVAIAPVFPECSFDDMLDVFNAVKEAKPLTYYMEPVNIRIGIAERIEAEANKISRHIDITPYKDKPAWAEYAIGSLLDAERAADMAGVRDRLHLWPDHADLGAARVVKAQAKVWDHPSGLTYVKWLESYWYRISEWPGKASN